MRFSNDIRKHTVVVLAFSTFAIAAWAADAYRNVAITVTNNTTTPAPEGQTRIPAGFVPVSCDGRAFQGVEMGQTVTVNCSVRGSESLTLTYTVHLGIDDLHYGTADIDCQRAATLTFTGSGEAVTFTKSCSDSDDAGDGPDDGGGSDDGGDSGGDG